ncbi:chromosome replication/partitioning protein (plasmid) [Borrelia coriaceae]|uniref:Putative plasmid partition protein n=1 Tax=Borrelia coriaceae ATCC 43381 TaxID=1408429 RepID=W5SWG7_9SPIR|nr:chromosome replication/partitioning protein [Borrelia coriaceae]AHH11539.1 Putative plasmid partition protein [Borrelia coriaceae ATCC 43381]UPA17161.1 chromosome replication/partitioning protein [Borrelia coriaceae]
MSRKQKKEIVLNSRKTSIHHFERDNDKDDEIEYESYKNQIRRITVNDISNKIELMKILYTIRMKKLYRLDGYKRFEDFLEKFVIARSQAFLYLRLYKKVLSGDLKMEEIKQFGFRESYKRIRKSGLDKDVVKENSIKPLRFQLESQESYDFYKKNTKFISYFLDRIFKDKKDLLEKFKKDFESLKN